MSKRHPIIESRDTLRELRRFTSILLVMGGFQIGIAVGGLIGQLLR